MLRSGHNLHPYFIISKDARGVGTMLWITKSHMYSNLMLFPRKSSLFPPTQFQRRNQGWVCHQWDHQGCPAEEWCWGRVLALNALLSIWRGSGMGLLPLTGLAGPLFDCVHLHSFICFLGELSLCHKCRFNICFFVFQCSLCYSIYFTALYLLICLPY